MIQRFLLGILALLCLVGLSGCFLVPGRSIPVEMTNFALTPAEVEVEVGERVVFLLMNTSNLDHEFESEDVAMKEHLVPSGLSRQVRWQAPAEPGVYEFECNMEGHEGMMLTVKVVEHQ